MNNRIYSILGNLLVLTGVVVGMTGCSKTIDESQPVAYLPANLDETAGNWKTYVLTSPTDVTLAAPAAANSTTYQAELDDLKTQSKTLTTEQQQSVTYWGAGAVYRWNEIARELSARYNLPPASTVDGKYPVPDAANPLADPRFPFANPPYTARALAYLSVAQYDALVATWYYKKQYNRAAPSTVDSGIKPALPVAAMSSYPSEDAVVAMASYTVLKAMFPGEVPYLDAKLAEHQNSRMWAGMNVASDVSAGTSLGGQVAAKVMARAKTDGMSTSNNQSVTGGMIKDVQTRGLSEVWLSQELPARPPMLPNYGVVKTWNFDQATMIKIRPEAPPAIGSPEFTKALDELKTIQRTQTREQARVANYWADGVGSYTPPGHWHRTAANASHDARYSEVRMARTLALVGTALMDAAICCWDTKYYYYYPRPQQFGLKTSVGLPNFPAYTSGHSTFSGAAAVVLSGIFPDQADDFMNKADEASVSRMYGLIHYRFDCEVGMACGKKIGSFATARGKADGSGI